MNVVAWKIVRADDINKYRRSGHTIYVPTLPGIPGPGFGVPPSVGTEVSVATPEAKAEEHAPKSRFTSRYVSRIRRRANGRMKLTPELRKAMTNLRKTGWTYVSIGKKYGVTPARCWQIVNQGR